MTGVYSRISNSGLKFRIFPSPIGNFNPEHSHRDAVAPLELQTQPFEDDFVQDVDLGQKNFEWEG